MLRLLRDYCRHCLEAGQELDAERELAFRRCVETVRGRLRARGVPVVPASPAPTDLPPPS